MFIASLICLILGIVLLIVAVILFFRLGVLDAWRFMNNKRRGRSTAGYGSTRPRKRHNMSSHKQKKAGKASPSGKLSAAEKLKSNIDNVVSNENAVKSQVGQNDSTYVLDEEDSESATSILQEESEQPTGLLQEDSEAPTGLLEEESEQPTGLLQEDSESPTGLLVEEDSEKPTGLLEEDSEHPTSLLEDDVITKKQDQPMQEKRQSDFKFEVVKNLVVVHTDETIT